MPLFRILLACVLAGATGPGTPLGVHAQTDTTEATPHAARPPQYASPLTLRPLDTRNSQLDTPLAHLENARVEEARLAYEQARSWKRLLPSVNLHAALSTHGHVFPAVSSQGYDPAYAAVQQWPGDTWGLSVSWRLDQLIDTRARKNAEAAYHTALLQRDVALARIEEEQHEAQRQHHADSLAARLRLDALADELRLALEEQSILQDLLRLARLRYESAEITYEALQRARLALLAKDAEVNRMRHEHTRLDAEMTHLAAAPSRLHAATTATRN